MSVSTPKPNDVKAGESSGLPGRAPGPTSPRWWLASLAFHAALVGWLLFLSPVRVIDPKVKPAANHVSASRAHQVVEQIRERQAASMEQNVRTLEDIAGKIADIEQRKREEFAAFARQMGANIPAKAAAEARDLAQVQAETLDLLNQAATNSSLYVRTRANAYYEDLRDAQRLAREKQARTLQLQEPIQGLLSLAGSHYASAQTALAEASAAQERAAKALAEAEAASGTARGSRKRTAHENQIEHFTYHFRRNREIVVAGQTNLVTALKRVEIAEAVLARRKTMSAEARRKAQAENTEQSRLLADTAEKLVIRAEKDLASERRRLEDAPKELEAARKRLPELEAKVAELLGKPDPAQPTQTAEDQQLIELQAAAGQLQLEVQQAQARAAQAIAASQGLKNDITAVGSDALAALDKAAPPEPLPQPATLKGMNLAQKYAAAQRIETSLTQSYRRLRALNLAVVRRLPLLKAIDLTEVAKPVRPDLSPGLLTAVSSGEDAVAAREAMQNAKAEVGAMVRLADSLLSQAQGLDASFGSSISMEDYNRQFDQLQTMEYLAAEDAGQWAADLSAMMGGGRREGGQSGGSGGSGGAGGGPGGGGPGNGRPGGMAPGNGGDDGGGLPDLGVTGAAGPFGGGGNGPGGFGMGGIEGARGEIARPENVADRVLPFPGRRVALRGPSAQWFFADSWYILGPFDNTGRRNIDKKFPPETVIDLNATYPGKNGVPIRWEFQQSGTPNVMPHLDTYNAARHNPALRPADNYMENLQYIIYYAYTELWFERECDLWVAIGSDDYSRVWIENQLVWSSGKNLKAWQLNEGLRKVHFKKGVNRVLYRVENGNNITEFSLVVSLLP